MLGSLIKRLLTSPQGAPAEGITTLIPAYKTTFFLELLIGLKTQTVPPKRILISDDSPDRAFQRFIREKTVRDVVEGMDIIVVDGPKAGAFSNFRHLLSVWNRSTSLVHLLMDDDVVYPDFYAAHIAAHNTGKYECTISRRWTALDTGQPIGQLPRPDKVIRNPKRLTTLDCRTVFSTTIPFCNNWLGEMSNAVFSHRVSDLFEAASLASIPYIGLGDIGFFLAASLKKPLGYLDTPLGSFRTHSKQTTQAHQSHEFKMGVIAWSALAIAARRVGQISSADALLCHSKSLDFLQSLYSNDLEVSVFCTCIERLNLGEVAAEEEFLKTWVSFSNKGLLPTAPP